MNPCSPGGCRWHRRTGIGPLLDELCRQPAPPAPPVPDRIRHEAELAGRISGSSRDHVLGTSVPLGCPECGGPLWEVADDPVRRYRCHVGHGFTGLHLLAEDGRALEQALWVALRTLEERVRVLTHLGRDSERLRYVSMSLEEKRQETQQHIETLRSMLQNLSRAAEN